MNTNRNPRIQAQAANPPVFPIRLLSLIALLALLLAACQPAGQSSGSEQVPVTAATAAPTATTAPAATEAPQATARPAAESASLAVASDPKLGEFLVDGKGMTLYMFTKDEPNKSNCTGGCLAAWPPFLAEGEVKAGDGVDASLIGSADMPDGTRIVTYNKMPLYYWQGDARPGDVNGQDVNQVWYVVSPAGDVIKTAGAAADDSSKAPAEGVATLNVSKNDTLGEFLVDGKGMTLYMFTKDEPDKSNCTGGCLAAWPPFLAEGEVKAGDGVDQSLIGTAALADGKKIVTYNKMPLYYWKDDAKPGDVKGQDVNQVWYVVSPAGEVIKAVAASDDSSKDRSEGVVTLNVSKNDTLGEFLVDGKGMTLYMFTKDGPNQSNCTGGCLAAWPPLIAAGEVKAGEGLEDDLIGTATLADGRKIVTYNKMPLYYWQGDTQPGDTSGQDVNQVWYAVSPAGEVVK